MISTILATALGAFGTLPAPGSHIVESEVRSGGIEVVLEVSETHFQAENFGDTDYLLVFGDAEQGVLSHTIVHARSSVSFEFRAGLLDGILLEVIAPGRGVWTGTGALPLGELVEKHNESIWLQKGESHINAWIERPEGFDLWSDFGPLAPESDRAQASEAARKGRRLLHVPVVGPSDEPEEEKPPVLEPKPLPPV